MQKKQQQQQKTKPQQFTGSSLSNVQGFAALISLFYGTGFLTLKILYPHFFDCWSDMKNSLRDVTLGSMNLWSAFFIFFRCLSKNKCIDCNPTVVTLYPLKATLKSYFKCFIWCPCFYNLLKLQCCIGLSYHVWIFDWL